MIHRFSSRRQRLDRSFLSPRLEGARAYDRIAGYFSSGILEVAAEALESMSGPVRVICNSQLDVRDVETARAAQLALRREWCGTGPENLGDGARDRFTRLHGFLRSGRLQVRVLPDAHFGLIHGKAGVITLADGRQTAFMGSANETENGWALNYELVWEDDSPEAVAWVSEEFNALWNHPHATPLADFVVEDLERLSRRVVIPAVDAWRREPEPAAPVIEAPVYRREGGLWEHQKYFVHLAFEAHRGPHGARFVLADQVGLGKTLQLAMAAQLMALWGDRPVLVLAPRTLLWQWQDELRGLLDIPSAVWNGRQWVDENGIEHPVSGPAGIRQCPRRIGIVSQGLVIRTHSEVAAALRQMRFECVVVDEAHRARRRNLGPGCEDEPVEPNNLMSFLWDLAPRTRSLLLATATPVQLNPVEVWDLLGILARGAPHVLGNEFSEWRRTADAVRLVTGGLRLEGDDATATETRTWRWLRNPLPPASEGRDFSELRRAMGVGDEVTEVPPERLEELRPPDRARVRRLAPVLGREHSPILRHVVRRTREFLENTIDPSTGETYLRPVRVRLFGEGDAESIRLPLYLQSAYALAGEFCRMLATRARGAGFLKTLLLRRVGSSIAAGRITVEKMLSDWEGVPEWDDEDDGDGETGPGPVPDQLRTLTPAEREKLEAFLDALKSSREPDPKFGEVRRRLMDEGWLGSGCIVFSQYFDSIWWLGNELSGILAGEEIGIYAGGGRSGILRDGDFLRAERDVLKEKVRRGTLRLILGTDAASEGLNLQRLGTLINLDLPWNPTRLEQRKGRIQRIGQLREEVWVYNMRYRDSVEDRVHDLLSSRLESIYQLFGQIPDVLEDVWVEVALGHEERARRTIDAVPNRHPFEVRYDRIQKVPWETCAQVLDARARRQALLAGWS